jgi:predicted dehydrogenase
VSDRRADLRFAVIGVGTMGARHVAVLQQMERTRLVAVADSDPDARNRAVNAAPGVREFSDWRVLLGQMGSSLDAVCVAAPSAHHAEIVIAALETGVHVLVEKPIATTVSDALRMRAAALDAGRKLMVGHVERFNPAVARVRELVREGRLGRIYRAHATRVGPFPARIQDTGVALDLASHDIDVMQHVLGEDLQQVFADGGTFLHGAHEDLVTCLLRFESGILGLLDVNWLSPEKRRELVLLGEAGMVRAEYLTQDVWFVESAEIPVAHPWEELALLRGDAAGSAMRFALRRVEPLRAELESFVDCILDDLPEPIDAHDGVRTLAVALAVRESARSRRLIKLLEMPAPRQAEAIADLS